MKSKSGHCVLPCKTDCACATRSSGTYGAGREEERTTLPVFPAPTPPRPTEILDDSRFKNDRRSNVRYSSKIQSNLMIYIIITANN